MSVAGIGAAFTREKGDGQETRRRAVLWIWATFVAALCVGWRETACASQELGVSPFGMAAPLLVKDRFERAVKFQSTSPSYLMATIVNDKTGEKKRVCIEGVQLFYGVRRENRLGQCWEPGIANWDKTVDIILRNAARTYHFKNPNAWREVQPHYTPKQLAAAQAEFRGMSKETLAQRFDYAKNYGILRTDDKKPEERAGHCAAVAYVMTERGLYVGRGDTADSLYLFRPDSMGSLGNQEMIARQKRQEQIDAEERQSDEAKGGAFARTLSGYAALKRHFVVTWHSLGTLNEKPCHYFTLKPQNGDVINLIYWVNLAQNNGKPRYNWKPFVPIAAHAERLARQHPWLQAWKKEKLQRQIEMKMEGLNIHVDSARELRNDVIPTWKEAGLAGKPYCELFLHQEDYDVSGSATVYLPLPGSGESRSLIVSSHPMQPPSVVPRPGEHWLERLSFRSAANAPVRQCVVVTPSGDWNLLTLPAHAPTKPPLSKKPKL